MARPFLPRAAARVRRSLGVTDLASRLDSLERRLDEERSGQGGAYPRGPLYFGDHTALVATRWGAKMLVDTRDAAIAPWLVLDGWWEPHVTAWIRDTLRPGQVFVDVGANVGYFTLLAGQIVGPSGRVIAVEAHPRLAELLQRNVVINGMYGYVTTWQRAAWSTAAELKFHARLNFAGNSSIGSIGSDALGRLGDTEEVTVVTALPVDELLTDVPRVDVLKVDVEGAEVQTFLGLARTLTANPEIKIMFEWSRAQIESVGETPASLVDLLLGHGFGFRLLETGAPVDRDDLLALPYGNVVATR